MKELQKLEDLWNSYIATVPDGAMADAKAVWLMGVRACLSVVKSNGSACTRNHAIAMETANTRAVNDRAGIECQLRRAS